MPISPNEAAAPVDGADGAQVDGALIAGSTALVVIDLQRAIVARPSAPLPAQVVVERCAGLARAARHAGMLVVLVRVSHGPGGATALRQPVDRPAPALDTSPGWDRIVDDLEVSPTDVVITKRQWGAFYGTDLDLQLRRRGLDTIVLCGIATEVGVESTARDAYERGYRLLFPVDAMTSTNADGHDAALRTVLPRLGTMTTSASVISGL